MKKGTVSLSVERRRRDWDAFVQSPEFRAAMEGLSPAARGAARPGGPQARAAGSSANAEGPKFGANSPLGGYPPPAGGEAADEAELISQAMRVLYERLRRGGRRLASSAAARDFLMLHLAGEREEVLCAMFLDPRHRLIAFERLVRGSVRQAHCYPRDVARRALLLDAAAVVLVHNHPSGNPTPSPADVDMTKRMRAALEPLEILVLDHMVVGADGVRSLSELGLI